MLSIINKSILAVTIVACIAQVVYWFGRVPAIMPSHFDGNGQVDGEMGRTSFFVLMGLLNALLLVGFPIIGRLLKKLPDSLINLPNKEYWLAPERREASMTFSTEYMILMGWLTSWLMLVCIHLTCSVAVGNRQTIEPEFMWAMGLYLVAVFGSLIYMYMRFRIPQDAAELQPR